MKPLVKLKQNSNTIQHFFVCSRSQVFRMKTGIETAYGSGQASHKMHETRTELIFTMHLPS